MEENSPIGGLSSIIAELIARHHRQITFASIALNDEAMMSSASRKWAEAKYGLTLDGIITKLRKMAKETDKV